MTCAQANICSGGLVDALRSDRCSLPEWAADVSALIVLHGHESKSSHALTLKLEGPRQATRLEREGLLESIVAQTTALSQTGRPAANVSALIMAYGHEIKNSDAVALGVYGRPFASRGVRTAAGGKAGGKYFCTD